MIFIRGAAPVCALLSLSLSLFFGDAQILDARDVPQWVPRASVGLSSRDFTALGDLFFALQGFD